MTGSRRKKILTWALLIMLVLVALGYAFRYPLIREYQYGKLNSLHCTDSITGKNDCFGRIWAHRVNTVERYEILRDKFHGFETDIAYDDSLQTYFVYHPPRPEASDLLTLKDFLSHVDFADTSNSPMVWLDTRGVDSSNMQRAMDALGKILLSIRDSVQSSMLIFIELYDLTAARFFAQNGFFVSFDPSERLLQRMITDTALRDSVNNMMGRIGFVSQDYHYVSFLKQFFPHRPILTWRPEFEVFIDTKELQKLLDDPRIAIVLVSIKSRYYR